MKSATGRRKTPANKSANPVARDTHSFYKQVIESLDDYCVFTLDKKGIITSWNIGAEKITGFKEEEIIGRDGEIIFTAEDRSTRQPEKELRRAKRDGRAVNERWHVRKDKTMFWGSGLVFPLKDENDTWLGFTKVMRDLTQRRNQEKDLQESESLSKSIFDSSPEWVKILDLKGNLLRMNQPGLQTMEIEDFTEYQGKSWLDFWQDDHYKAAKSALQNAKKGESYSFRGFTPTAKGNPKWWDVTVTPIRSADDSIRQLLCVSRDITTLKQQEDKMQNLIHELEMEKNKLIDVFEKAPAFLAILRGPDHVFEMANKAYYQIIGDRNIIGKKAIEALPEIKGQGLIEVLNKVYNSGKPFTSKEMKVYMQRQSDQPLEERYVSVVYKAAKDARGKITGIYANGYDITEEVVARKLVEESQAALKQSEERLQQLADSMPQMVWTATPSGTMDYYNKQWYEYTGLKETVENIESWKHILHPEDQKFCIDTWHNAVSSGTQYEIEYRLKDVNGSGDYRWFLARALPIRNKLDKIVKWIGTCTDIQEHKQLQRQKDDFLAIASHELKTPVTSIKAYGQVLEGMLRSKGDTGAADMLKRMDGQVNKLTNLIGDLLDVTKIQSGRLQLNEAEFDFNEMVTEIITDMQRTTYNHKLITKLGKLPRVYGDKERIGQVLINFITNAVKYSPKADKIIITTARARKSVKLCVEDYGIGIPADKKDEVFGQFYRISGDKQITYPGLGLGLYISSEIIKRAGGEIWVESKEDRGSVFCFTVPEKGK